MNKNHIQRLRAMLINTDPIKIPIYPYKHLTKLPKTYSNLKDLVLKAIS